MCDRECGCSTFQDIGVQPSSKGFIGDKVYMDDILGKEIIIYDYKIGNSKYVDRGSGLCLQLAIGIDEKRHVVFNGSAVLMDVLKKIQPEDFPFKTKIIKQFRRYEFT